MRATLLACLGLGIGAPLAVVGAEAVDTATAGDGSLKLDFTRSAGPPLAKRREHTLQLPLYNDLPHQCYLINITVGTPPQPFAVTADTGSGDLWVPAANSSCGPHCPPTFKPNQSSTYRVTDREFNATYGLSADGLQIVGPYFHDTVRLGGITLPNVTALGLGDVPAPLYVDGLFGIMGLGPRLQETLVGNPASPDYHNFSAAFPLIYDLLYDHGYISKKLFSIWLNDADAATGSILFGGIDRSKYHGTLKDVPVVLDGPGKIFGSWTVNLSSVALCSGKASRALVNTTTTVVLDSGSPNLYMPAAVAQAVATDLNATMHQGFPYVSCRQRQSSKTLAFTFGDHAALHVPYGEIIYPFADPANIGPVTGPDGEKLCYLGLIETPGPIYLLGDPFIRSTYVVYDVAGKQVRLAPVRYA